MNKKNIKFITMLMLLVAPMFMFGAADDFVVPFKDLMITWMQGNVGTTAAIVIMAVSIVGAFFGGGFAMVGKGFLFSILIGGIIFFADKAIAIGGAFA